MKIHLIISSRNEFKTNIDIDRNNICVYLKKEKISPFQWYAGLQNAGKSQKKCSFFSGPTTKALAPPPLSLVVTFFEKGFFELQEKWVGLYELFCGFPY